MEGNQAWNTVIKGIILAAVVIGAIWLLNSISWVISLLLISTLIVYALYPVLSFLKTKAGFPHPVAVGVVFMAFLLICILAVSLLIPVVYAELTEIADNFPFYINKMQEYMEWVTEQLLHLEMEDEFRHFLLGLPQGLSQVLEYIFDGTLVLVFGVVDLFFLLFIVFYLLYDFNTIREQVVDLVPLRQRSLAKRVIILVDTNVGGFIRGSLLRCLIVGTVTGFVLYLIGMSHAFLLGFLAGIFNFVLYIGPYIAAIPALLLSFSPTTPAPYIVLLVYVLIQVLEGALLAPALLGKTVKLKPITIIVSILIGGRLGGILGMVIAIPLAGIVKGLLEMTKETSAYREL